jgi:hypothetical protein
LLIVASSHRLRPVISTQHLKPWFPHQINIVARHEPPFSIHRLNETGEQDIYKTICRQFIAKSLKKDTEKKRKKLMLKMHTFAFLYGMDINMVMLQCGMRTVHITI